MYQQDTHEKTSTVMTLSITSMCSHRQHTHTNVHFGERAIFTERKIRNYHKSTGSSSPCLKAMESCAVSYHQFSGIVPELYYMRDSACHQLDSDTYHTPRAVIN